MTCFKNRIEGCLILILILFPLSCEPKIDFAYSNFKEVDSLEIEMPQEYLQITNWSTYDWGKKEILVEYGFNKVGSLVIHRIDFIEQKYLDPIIIERDGPRGYNSSSASVYFKSPDSIFVFPSARPFFLLYNQEGKLLEQFYYNSTDNSRYYLAGFNSTAVSIGDKIMIPTVQDLRYDDPRYFSKSIPIKLYDFEENEFNLDLQYPSYVLNKVVPSGFTGPTLAEYKEESVLINYRFADSLYIWNSKSKSSVYAGSKHFGHGKLLNRYPSRGENLDYRISEVDYEFAKYHNNNIYRVISHVSPNAKSLKAFEIMERKLRKVSLIELDIKSKSLTYYELPIAKYFVFQGDHLIAGGVSIREEGTKTLRKFYKYTLN